MQITAFVVASLVASAGQTRPAPSPVIVTVEGCVTRESAASQTAAGAREPSAAMQFVLTEHTAPAP
ncbi:MAG: hypothetical protein ABL982_26300, partial [Vicinamibacterales bacterium]